jgi:small basic protein (TIGR04137 family)
MTIHSSLKLSGATGGQRNVWTRLERIMILQKAGKWKEGDDVEGLRKVRTSFKAKAKKKAAAEGEKPAAAAGAAAAPAAGAPAAGAAPAAGGKPAAGAPAKAAAPAAKPAAKK